MGAAPDTGPDPKGPGAVALVLLGFAFLIGFTVLAVIVGLRPLQALLVGWIGSLLCVILAAVWSALLEERAYAEAAARGAEFRERQRRARMAEWDTDAAADAAVAGEVLAAEDGSTAMPGAMRDITPMARRA
jgi:hypothetical protein